MLHIKVTGIAGSLRIGSFPDSMQGRLSPCIFLCGTLLHARVLWNSETGSWLHSALWAVVCPELLGQGPVTLSVTVFQEAWYGPTCVLLHWPLKTTGCLPALSYGSNRPAPRLSPVHGGNLFLPTLLSMQLTVPVPSSFLGKLILSSNDWEYKTLALDIREFYSNDSMYFAYQRS